MIAKLIFNLLPNKGKVSLSIDRTNWQFGKTDINIFMLGVVYQGVAFPLLFSMLPKKGNSNSGERINLIERFINLFGRDCIESLSADREFVGHKWLDYLNAMQIKYYIRIRNNFKVFMPHKNEEIKVYHLFNQLDINEFLYYDKIVIINGVYCYISGCKCKDDFLILISFNKPQKALEEYAKRWQIEMCFKALKSSGFDIENTHLTHLERIERLILLVMIAFVWCYKTGIYLNEKVPIKIKKHGRKAKSIFKYGLDYIGKILLNAENKDSIEIFKFLSCTNITYIRNERNMGMGYAVNQGLAVAKYDHIAYLPSDDFYYADHLKEIKEKFDESNDAILVYTGMKYDLNDLSGYVNNHETLGFREGYSLQLVQTAHRKTQDQWLEREEWITDNLALMFWEKLEGKGDFVATNNITCNWTNHPHQRHKIINEKYGGSVHYYRTYYDVRKPVKIRISDYKFIDQEEEYKNFQKPIKPAKDALKILIVGELAYHPDRIYALEEAGHQLYGLWVERPTSSIMMTGPLPFGNVIDIPYENYEKKVNEIKPDVIYGLLSTEAIPLAYEVLKRFPDVPFVWHLKESGFHAIRIGTWKKLIYLYTHADGKIFINEEIKAWYEQFIPNIGTSFILDGDLPKIDYFNDNLSKRISSSKDEIHTVIPGRLVGISPEDVQVLAKENIHIHVYTENYHHYKVGYLYHLRNVAPNHIHLHPNCVQEDWVKEFSQYDAGWLHYINSNNQGNLLNAIWDDLNIPARMTTLAAAGLPMIQKKQFWTYCSYAEYNKTKKCRSLF